MRCRPAGRRLARTARRPLPESALFEVRTAPAELGEQRLRDHAVLADGGRAIALREERRGRKVAAPCPRASPSAPSAGACLFDRRQAASPSLIQTSSPLSSPATRTSAPAAALARSS